MLGDDRYARFKKPIDYAMKHGYCGILLNFLFAVSTTLPRDWHYTLRASSR